MTETKKQMNPKTGNKIAGCIMGGIVLFIVLMIVIGASGSKDKADKVAVSPTSTAVIEQKIAEPVKTETPNPYSYEIIKESIEGSTATINVFSKNTDDARIIAMNDEIFDKYKSGKTHVFINYFDDKDIGVTYFDRQLDDSISESQKDELFKHYFAQMKYNTTSGLKKLYKNSGDWTEIKSY